MSTSSLEKVDGNDLVGMGARYWYAMATKLAQSLVTRYLANEGDETLEPDMRHLANLMDQGPWKQVDADVRAMLQQLLPSKRTRKSAPDAPSPVGWVPVPFRPNEQVLKDALLERRPDLANFPYAIDAWARNTYMVTHMHECIAVNGPAQADGTPWPLLSSMGSWERLARDYAKSLGLTPTDLEALNRMNEEAGLPLVSQR